MLSCPFPFKIFYHQNTTPVNYIKRNFYKYKLLLMDDTERTRLQGNRLRYHDCQGYWQGLPRLPTEYTEAHNVLGHRKLSLILFLI